MRQQIKRVSLVSLVLILAGCATGPVRPSAVSYAPVSGGVTHSLMKGETIWRLAETYGVSANSILRANRIADPTDLKVGTPIWVPGVHGERRVLPYLPLSKQWQYIVVHHSATEVGNAELFDRGHRKRGFWNGLGYHFVIDNGRGGTRDGAVEVGHRWNRQMDGAHCNAADMNHKGIGICLVGNFDHDSVSGQQLASLVWLVRQLQATYRIPASRVVRHNDVPGKQGKTDCPGTKFPWASFRKQLLS